MVNDYTQLVKDLEKICLDDYLYVKTLNRGFAEYYAQKLYDIGYRRIFKYKVGDNVDCWIYDGHDRVKRQAIILKCIEESHISEPIYNVRVKLFDVDIIDKISESQIIEKIF